MSNLNKVYKCDHCGYVVEVLHVGGGKLICCGEPMKLLKENTVDAATEKHVPVIEKQSDSIIIKVGSVEHPMEDKHYIEFIELLADGKLYRKFLKPGEKPEVTFKITAEKVEARAYCNLHGLWKD